MSTQEERVRLAELLEKVASDQMSAEEALARLEEWPDTLWKERLLSDSRHFLYHFRDDADIRAKEPKYARMQHEGLLTWAQRLRKG